MKPARAIDGRSRPPLPPASLIGREAELLSASELLTRPQIRLLTIRGPGGIGKTHFALELTRTLAPEYDLGTVWIDLTDVGHPQDVLAAVARAVNAETAEPDGIARAIEPHALLLVLDNFEHVLDASPQVAGLLARCPNLRVIVTSRVPLHLRGEQELPLGPLDLTGGMRGAAVRLFETRARQVAPDFSVTSDNEALVERICERLDGVPLAIELAAARLRAVSPAGLLDWLDRPLDVLEGGPHDGPHHSRSVRDTLTWSFRLLDEPERTLLGACGTCTGSFDLTALQALTRQPNVQGTLARLVEHSLVQLQPVTSDAPSRWKLLDTVRAYAVEQLATHDETTYRDRHARHFLALAERAERHGELLRPEWHARLALDDANLHAALDWLVRGECAAQALRMVHALDVYWGRASTARKAGWMRRALALPSGVESRALRAAVLSDLGAAERALGHFDEAGRALREALDLYLEQNDPQGVMEVRAELASLLSGLGQCDESLDLFRQVEEDAVSAGDDLRLAVTLVNTGVTFLRQDRPQRAEVTFERAHEVATRAGYDLGVAFAVTQRAWSAYVQGRDASSRPLAREAWTLALRQEHVFLHYVLVHQLAFRARDEGRLTLAARMVGWSEHAREQTGEPWDVCFAPHARTLDVDLYARLGASYAAHREVGASMPDEDLRRDVQEWLDALDVPGAIRSDPLSAREWDVLRLLALGATDKRIARDLGISAGTVGKHVSNMLGKLELRNRVALARWANERTTTGFSPPGT
ncbi:tetratricopeptide repeat protein [Deinococcus pimensis]|uniref:tetratricopeptide repeat protein n=1 Tax=Deinococcus pimensis TaxID=309888 RepID=UPI00146FB897|nr:tetratricopeptide repeat protein [Deinococcus pimensis]